MSKTSCYVWKAEKDMQTDDLAMLEYEALRTEERDRINARLQVWAIFVSLSSIFGVVSLQSGIIAYVVALFPLLCLCLAFHIRHSEEVLHQIRKYLYSVEKRHEYEGYEHFVREQTRATHGSYLSALRYAFIATQLLAIIVLTARLLLDNAPFAIIVVIILINGYLLYITWRWLKK
jgi:hypothetical protein